MELLAPDDGRCCRDSGCKGIHPAHAIQQLRTELSISRREALSSKSQLVEKQGLLNRTRRDSRGREYRIARLQQDIGTERAGRELEGEAGRK